MRVNNSALTVNGKSVNIDLTYLEKAIEEVELTPGPQGVPGSAATITGATAAIGTNEGDTPTVTVNSTGTDMARGFNFVFDNLKGKKGDDGAAAVFTAVTATVSNNSGTPKVTVVSAGTSTVGLEFKFSGLKGEQGPQGEKGADGTSINILGSFDSENDLNDITNPKNGDAYIINGYLYVWNGTKWENVGQIKGPQGENGVTPVFSSATATITNTTGTLQVTITSAATGSVYSLDFAFSGLKGADGKDGIGQDGVTPEFSSVKASVANTTGTPQVTVTSASTGSVYSLNFAFSGLKGADGKNGNTPVFTAVTANVTNTSGTPEVNVTSAATGSEYSLKFDFSGLKGEKGEPGGSGASGERGYSYFSTIFDSLSSESTAITKSYVNNSGSVRTNDYIVSEEGEVFLVTSTTGTQFKLSYVSSFRGPQGEPGGSGASGERGYSYFSTISDSLSSASTIIGKSNVNNSGSVRNNDYIVSTEGEVFKVTGSTTSYFYLSYVASFRGPQGEPGDPGSSGATGERGYSYFSTISDSLTSASTAITKSSVNNSGDVRTNDYIVSKEGEVFLVTSTTGIQFKLSYVSSFRGPQGATGTFDSSELNNYVQKGNTDYLNTNAFGFIVCYDNVLDASTTISAMTASDMIHLIGTNGIKLSGFTSPGYKQLKIEAPKMVFKTAEDSYATDYPLLGVTGYNIVLEKFLTLETGLYTPLGSGYSNVFLNVKTGITKDTVAVGNHTHEGVYLTEGDLENYDFGTTVSQTAGTSTYYLLGVASKTATTVTQAYVSSTDIYMQGGEIYAASDETLKNFGENIEVDFDKLAEIPKVYYTWKTDVDNKQQIGTSAQKLREIYPELVSESEDGKLAVSYEKLSVIALSAVDKLHKENEELKERLRKIEEKLGI